MTTGDKCRYSVKRVSKEECVDLLTKYHYLAERQRGFKSGFNYGLCVGERIVGVCIFTGIPVKELLKGCFGLSTCADQSGLFELSRLVLEPEVQSSEHNLASWFVARCIRDLRKVAEVRAILSYADADFHSGTVYKALGFTYYGLTAAKKDFWIKQNDGTYVKHSRGKTKGIQGEWRARSRKHRFLKIFDSNLNCLWEEETYV